MITDNYYSAFDCHRQRQQVPYSLTPQVHHCEKSNAKSTLCGVSVGSRQHQRQKDGVFFNIAFLNVLSSLSCTTSLTHPQATCHVTAPGQISTINQGNLNFLIFSYSLSNYPDRACARHPSDKLYDWFLIFCMRRSSLHAYELDHISDAQMRSRFGNTGCDYMMHAMH